MPSVAPAAAPVEPAQVRRFSAVVGLVVVVVVGCTWGSRLYNDPSLAFWEDDVSYRWHPWEAPDPGTATWSGSTISGPAGPSVLHLKAADRPTEPLGMTMTESDPYVAVFTYDGTPRTDGLPDEPSSLGRVGSYYPTPTVLPDDEKDLTLWFYAETAWTASLAPLNTTPLTDQASGKRRTFLHYVGPDGPHLLHMSCLATPEDPEGQTMTLEAYTAALGNSSLGRVGCPGETTIWVEQVPTVLEVDGGIYGIEWTLTLEHVASPEPEPPPGG